MHTTTLRTLRPLFATLAAVALAGCGGGGDAPAPAPAPPAQQPPTQTCSQAGVAASNASTAAHTVCMLTTQGEVVIELYSQQAPQTVTNFLSYVTQGRYTNTVFHRVVRNFVDQAGGYKTDHTPITTAAPIPLESNNGLSNVRGTIAMARTSAPNSATSQFYFNVVDNSACLDYGKTICDSTGQGYAVFGRVISGLATLDAINAVPVNAYEQPRTDVVLYWAQQLK